jgi:glycosyltransferase involved in cell wall biosynthesis
LALATYLHHRPPALRPRVLCLSTGPLVTLLRDDGIPTDALSLHGRPTPREAGAFVRRLYGSLLRSPPAVVLAAGNKAAILAAPAAAAAGVPLVWHRVDLALNSRTVGVLARAASGGVIAISRAVAGAIPRARLLGIVPPPVRLPETFRVTLGRSPATIGSVGQLHPVKGHHEVIAAAALLHDEFPELRVVIAGGEHPAFPEYPAQLLALAAHSGLADRVELTGHVDRVEDVYSRLSVLVSGTYRHSSGAGPEGLGAAIAEGSWAGLPVVATRGGGTAEVVDDGVTGRLVAPLRPKDMAEAVAGYLRDPGAAATAGEAGARLTRARFRPGPVSARLFSLVEHAAQRRRKNRDGNH